MKFTIITVCYNSEKYIEHAIKSVLGQTYRDIEYIIIDGNSTDHTLEIVNRYSHSISKIISEPDNGIYDAMNKGVEQANGDVIGFLNSDDIYINNQVIEEVNNLFIKKKISSIYADLFYVNRANTNKIVRKWSTGRYVVGSFKKGWHPAHPTFFVKKNIYKQYGGFNLVLKLAADFELMLRFLEKHQISNFYLNKALIKMRLGGATSKSLRNLIHQNKECVQAFRLNDIKPPLFYPILRILPKLKQYF